MKKLAPLSCALLALCITAAAFARDYCISPDGAGQHTGVDFANAMSKSQLQTDVVMTVKPGDRIRLASGTYAIMGHHSNVILPLTQSGTAAAPITLEGVDTGAGLPQIVGKWSEKNITYHAHSAEALALADGVSHLRIANLKLARCMVALRTAGQNTDVNITNVAIDHCREGFRLKGLSQSTIENCTVTHYTKRGIRFEAACDHLHIVAVRVDATVGETDWPTELFPFGFSIEDEASNHDIRFDRCVAQHNLMPNQGKHYWNGDGFVAEAAPTNLSFYDCESFDNTDGGFDVKSPAAVFVNCVSLRNKRGFRLWNAGGTAAHPTRLTNCLAAYSFLRGGIGSAVGIWTCGPIEIDHCTAHDNADFALEVENNKHNGAMVAHHCILSVDAAGSAAKSNSKPLIQLERDTKFTGDDLAKYIAGQTGDDPQYVAPARDWTGAPADAFNSRRYGHDKGYFAVSPTNP